MLRRLKQALSSAIAVLMISLLPMSGQADEATEKAFYVCFETAAKRYNVEVPLLLAIAQNESAMNPQATNINTDKSQDSGLMQINDLWLDTLGEFGIDRPLLLSDPCTNIYVGAWILAQNIQRYGYNWEAVGAYNAGHRRTQGAKKRRYSYAIKVQKQYIRFKRSVN